MLHIRLLDAFELRYDDGSAFSITSARQRELLVYLILHRKTARARSQIAFLFWPDTSDKQAQRNLRAQLSRLRSQWSEIDCWLNIGQQTLQWRQDGPYSLDVATFENTLARARVAYEAGNKLEETDALQAAIEVYRGPLVPGLLEDWILVERERLEQEYLQALARLVVLLEDQRRYAEAIAVAQRLLRYDPVREDTYRQLMRLYAVSGDRALALRTYHTCVTVLSREMGVKPDLDTDSLYQRLISSGQADRGNRSTSRQTKLDPLVGRRQEWQQLLRVWRQVLDGEARFLLIAGEAGIGKSRLAQEFFGWTRRQGVAAARTRAYAAAGSLAYTPVIEWLRSNTLRPTLSHLAPVWLVEVARLLPELMTEYPNLPAPAPLTDSWQRRRLFEGLARACRVDTQPRLLLLDDLQWCDEESLTWLRFFLRFEPENRTLIVGTVRPQEMDANHPLQELLADLRAENRLTEVHLSPLNLEESVALAEQVVDQPLAPLLRDRLFAETAGNPLFIVETAKVGVGERADDSEGHSISLPPKIYAVIRSRLDWLSTPARALVDLAATTGRSFTFSVLSAASSLAENRLVDALDELWRQGILREHGTDAYDFSHDRIRDVAYAEISPIRRAHFHRVVAKALEQIHTDSLDAVAAQLAFHWSTGGNPERAIDYYQQAAVVALDRLALSEVVVLLRACLTLLDKLPQSSTIEQRKLAVMLQMYDPFRSTKGWPSSEMYPYCLHMHELSRTVGTRRQQVEATSILISYSVMQGQQRQGLDYAHQLVALAYQLPGGPSLHELSMAHGQMGTVLLRMGRLAAAQDQFALGAADPDHHFDRWGVLVMWLRGYADQAQQMVATFFDLAGASQPFDRAVMLTISLQLCYCMRQQETLREYTERLIELAGQYEMSFWQAVGALFQGWSWIQSGEDQAGLSSMIDGIKGMEQAGAGVFTLFLSMLAAAYVQTGHFVEAKTTLQRALDYADSGGEHFWYAELQRQMADTLHAQGCPIAEVEMWYQQSLQTARDQGARSLELRAAVGLCWHWRDHGRPHAARDLLAPLYASFTEGFDTADLIEAKELLQQLS